MIEKQVMTGSVLGREYTPTCYVLENVENGSLFPWLPADPVSTSDATY